MEKGKCIMTRCRWFDGERCHRDCTSYAGIEPEYVAVCFPERYPGDNRPLSSIEMEVHYCKTCKHRIKHNAVPKSFYYCDKYMLTRNGTIRPLHSALQLCNYDDWER